MFRRMLTLVLLAATLGVPAPALAAPLVLDYTGFSWSLQRYGNPGTFSAVGIIDGFSLPVAVPTETYTFYLSQLWLTEVITHSASVREYVYMGGDFSIYRSTSPLDRRFTYGINPASPVAPGSFIDGTKWLGGGLTSFRFLYNATLRLGTLNAQGVFTSGEFLGSLSDRNWSSFAGITGRAGNGIPTGYSFRLDGQETANLGSPIPEAPGLILLGLGLSASAAALRRRRTR